MKAMTRTIATMVLAMFVAAPAAFAQTDETPVKDQTKLQTKTQLNDGACDGDGPIKDQLKTQDQKKIHFTDAQMTMVTENQENAKVFRETFRATLSEEQLAILENQEMTREEKRAALMASLTEEQQEILQAQEQVREENRQQFRRTNETSPSKVATNRKLRKCNSRSRAGTSANTAANASTGSTGSSTTKF